MHAQSTPAVLSPEAAARLSEFARACKAAARAVGLYPPGHPAIATTLARLAQTTASLTQAGPCRLEVAADRLSVGGAVPQKPDAGVYELADLLYRHRVGVLTVNPAADAESWRSLLLLLARTPDDVRANGGLRHLWATAGGPSLEIDEIDYSEVLRDKDGAFGTLDEILAAASSGAPLELEASGARLLLDVVQDPARLEDLMAQLQAATTARGAEAHAAAFLSLVRELAAWLTTHEPSQLEGMLERTGQAAGRLTAEAMLKLLHQRGRPDAMAGTMDVASAITGRMSDASIVQFVAGSVVRERGATERLAHAFQALAPDADQQRRLIALAEQEVTASEGGGHYAELWERMEGMLTSYSDESYVSEEYARELASARSQPIDLEAMSEDPPERITAWLATVADGALRSLDQQLVLDLLAIEPDPLRWRDIAETAAAHAEDLVRVGYFDQAWQLADALVREGAGDARRPHASAALARFGRGGIMKGVAMHFRGAGDASYERFTRVCHAIGPAVIPPLAEALSTEQDARSRRRLRDLLVGFGASGRESVRQLMNAPNWEVRRTAAFLLREFGGAEGLKELIPLLTDSEPLVQREAVQALVLNGSDEASKTLLQAVTSASGRSRDTLLHELSGMRDDRAAPLFCYLVRQMDRRTHQQLYLTAVEALGTVGGPDAVDALKHALYEGTWRAPLMTRRIRTAAAAALRRIRTPAAMDILRGAAAGGSRGVRAAARAQLEGLE